MTRMTSDVEALQQLLQDGLVQFARAGAHHARRHRDPVLLQRRARAHHAAADRARRSPASRCGSAARPTRATTGCATASPACSATCRRACRACASSPGSTGSGTTCSTTATWSASTATPTTTPRGIAATYGAGSELIGLLGQAALLGHRRHDGAATARLSVGELAAFILYLNSFFQPIQQLVQQYNLYQQGQAAITKLNELLAHASRAVEEADDAEPLPPIDGDVDARPTCRSAYDPAMPVLRDVDLHIARGRDDVVRRSDRRGEVDDRQARHALLRPHGGQRRRSTATTSATSRSSRCAGSSASSPRSRSSSPAPSATTSSSPGPTPTDDEI